MLLGERLSRLRLFKRADLFLKLFKDSSADGLALPPPALAHHIFLSSDLPLSISETLFGSAVLSY